MDRSVLLVLPVRTIQSAKYKKRTNYLPHKKRQISRGDLQIRITCVWGTRRPARIRGIKRSKQSSKDDSRGKQHELFQINSRDVESTSIWIKFSAICLEGQSEVVWTHDNEETAETKEDCDVECANCNSNANRHFVWHPFIFIKQTRHESNKRSNQGAAFHFVQNVKLCAIRAKGDVNVKGKK